MGELSYPWPETAGPVIGDGRQYTAAEWDQGFEIVFQQMKAATVAVLRGVWNELAVTSPGANQISVNTGAAMGKGHIYWNDAALALAPASAPGGQTRDDAVVLETDWLGGGVTAQYTTRIVLKTGAMGAPPAMTQVDGTLWQNRLYNFTIDDAGAITGITDFRAYCKFATDVGTAMLENECVTAAKIAAAVAGAGLLGGAGAALSVNPDGSTLELSGDTVRVKDLGITNAKLASNCKRMNGEIIMWSGTMGAGADADYPIDPDTAVVNTNWHICNGDLEAGVQTPDLRDRFVVAAGPTYAAAATGGAATHLHAVSIPSDLGGAHNHTMGGPDSTSGYGTGASAAANNLHAHTNVAAATHQHGVNGNTVLGSTLPPYYALVFLCYVG